ncbi:uncharacterized protein il17rb [Genypterus blacodes]|uniref:uncharacterized protein il17rb n=1 Tax=Genypterus blacodes TaxID=154954 RepID=UPI003F765BCD
MLCVSVATLFTLVAQVTSHGIAVSCSETGLPPCSDKSPSVLWMLNLQPVTDRGITKLNISWAINVDVSIKYLTGTRIMIAGEPYLCKYSPPLDKAELSGMKQVWFHFLKSMTPGSVYVQAANLPLPPLGSGAAYIGEETNIPFEQSAAEGAGGNTPVSPVGIIIVTQASISDPGMSSSVETRPLFGNITIVICAGLAGLIILTALFLTYRIRGWNFVLYSGTKHLPASPRVPVSVLLVYPAEDAAFQKAVLALAEFLQYHGDCKVAVDMWQQGKIAELGPIRWLAEQSKAAERVIIVCPQPHRSLPKHADSGVAVSAAAHDLYPLMLNTVASHARCSSDLAKFWVVQLGKRQDRTALAAELRTCKSFCLMRDLDKLCRRLHAERKGEKKTARLMWRPEASYSEQGAFKLREAMGQLLAPERSTATEAEPLRAVTVF